MRSTSRNTGSCEIDVEQRFGRRELEDLSVLVQAVEAALAQFEEPGSSATSVRVFDA